MRLKKSSYDYYLILATTVVLFIISAICIWGMFFFKMAQIQQMSPTVKIGYLDLMNSVIAPFVICLILLLGICVPKRLLSTAWLNRFALFLGLVVSTVAVVFNIKMGLLVVLTASLGLQLIVLFLAMAGSKRLHFETKGYWLRVGSSLVHLGLILFILDLFFFRFETLHLVLFWVTTVATTAGMGLCFYSGTISNVLRGKKISSGL
jgi:hypothetical protein